MRCLVIAGVGQELQLRAERIDVVRRSSASPAAEINEQASAAPAAPLPPAADTVDALRRRYQLAASIAAPAVAPTPVRWRRLRMDNALRAQEGHSAALLDDRWMIVIGGSPYPLYLLSLNCPPSKCRLALSDCRTACSGFGGGIRNDVAALDTFTLSSSSPSKPVWVRVNVSGLRPRPVYGHTSTTLPTEIFGDALGLLGGVQYGSYQGDVGDFSVLQIDLPSDAASPDVTDAGDTTQMEEDEKDTAGTGTAPTEKEQEEDVVHELQLSGRWVEYSTEGECESRAYQGVTVADVGGAKHLVVYGGIHESAASGSLQLLDLSAKKWFSPETEGRPPNSCMGCSAAFIPAQSGSNRSHVVFIGGSDGNDLLRYYLS